MPDRTHFTVVAGQPGVALAMAIQNLMWGVGAAFAGALADRFGPFAVMGCGAVLYGLGIWGMAEADSGTALYLFGGVVTGLGVALTNFSIALAAIAKVVGAEKRSLALGLGMAAGSMGQVIFSPLGIILIAAIGWQLTLFWFAAISLAILPLALMLPRETEKDSAGGGQSMAEALREAIGHRGFVLLTCGFFVCGFHVAFIGVHFPAYVTDLGMAAEVGAYALALIGLFNIAGSLLSGAAGQRWSKRRSLSTIYALRALVITALLLAPKNEVTIYLFAAAMGLLWLSTIPLTTGIVAQIFGVRYMATLSGIVFFSHQVGSFIGIWLGGWLYDNTGSYDGVWWTGVALGLLAALVHLPIDEKPLPRLSRQPA